MCNSLCSYPFEETVFIPTNNESRLVPSNTEYVFSSFSNSIPFIGVF